jgi:hypothetical protein
MKHAHIFARPSRTIVGLLFAGLWLTALGVACGPSPTETATPSPSPEPTQRQNLVTPTPTETPTRAPSPTATHTATVTSTPEPTATLTATATATETPTATPEPTPTATATETPLPAPTATLPPLPTPTPTAGFPYIAPGWQGEYYANPDLQGNPVLARQDAVIGFDWGVDPPAHGLPAEGFSVRWRQTARFEEGLYDFHATMDDGMRVYVDGVLAIDEWRDEAERTVTVSRHLSAGLHDLQVEYYDRQHHAIANLWWERNRVYHNWKGVYWADTDLRGNPSLIRDDGWIDFNWGAGSPGAGIPGDRFSARWTRALPFAEGLYRFTIHVDDGVRLWVDERLLIDDWRGGAKRELVTDYVLAGTGPHALQLEYYEDIGLARVHLNWSRIGDPSYAGWKGEYFTNPHLDGDPRLVRNDDRIHFNWEEWAPAPSLPADNFSVRWTRHRQIEPGWYRFTFHTDDGVRLYVDDELVLDEWHQSWAEDYVVEVELPWKPELVVEYYEGSGDARARMEMERIR